MPSVTDLLPGSYTVGLCGCVDGTVAPATDISWLTVQVLEP
jgi:hypothetical protein